MLPNQLLLSGSIRKMCCWFSLLLVAVVIYQNAFAQLLDENCKVKITYRVANGHTAITSQFMAALYNNSEFSVVDHSYISVSHLVFRQEIRINNYISRICSNRCALRT